MVTKTEQTDKLAKNVSQEGHDAAMLCNGRCVCPYNVCMQVVFACLFVNLDGRPGTSPEGVSKTRAPALTFTKKPMIKGRRFCSIGKQSSVGCCALDHARQVRVCFWVMLEDLPHKCTLQRSLQQGSSANRRPEGLVPV